MSNTVESNGRGIFLLKKKSKPIKERKKPKIFELDDPIEGKFEPLKFAAVRVMKDVEMKPEIV